MTVQAREDPQGDVLCAPTLSKTEGSPTTMSDGQEHEEDPQIAAAGLYVQRPNASVRHGTGQVLF